MSRIKTMDGLEVSERQLMYQVQAQHHCSKWQKQMKAFSEFNGCPPHFDGVVCWPPTLRGRTANQSCPSYLADPASVTRQCDGDGTWEGEEFLTYESCGLDETQVLGMKRQYARMMEEDATTATSTSEYRFYLQLLDECNAKKKEPPPPYVTEDESRYCPIAFDGWTCWDYTPAGTVAYNPCPFFIVGFDPRRYAFRPCLENGTWFHHPQSNQTWSNYTTCVDVDDLQFRQMVNHLYITGYTISVIALLLSLIIFFSFRSLKCTRIAIHVQLFLSFAANNLMWIVWYNHVVGNVDELKENGWACQALHVILQYLMVANYMWMFCEGLHLHLALVVVFVKDEIVMRWFYFVGWGFPGIVTAAYTIARTRKVEYTKQCWMNESVTQWILIAPVLLSLVASLVFLVNVVRVLLTKLHSNSANPAPVGMRKAVRATLILVPLFGLQHILLPFRPEPNQPGEHFYQLFSAVVISLQGFCVSCLFCFANVDVHCAIRPLIRRIFPWVGRPACGESGNLCNAANTHTQSRDVCV